MTVEAGLLRCARNDKGKYLDLDRKEIIKKIHSRGEDLKSDGA